MNLTDLLKDPPENPSTLTIPSWVKDKGGGGGGGGSDDEEGGGDVAPATKSETVGPPPLEPMPPVCTPACYSLNPAVACAPGLDGSAPQGRPLCVGWIFVADCPWRMVVPGVRRARDRLLMRC